MKRDLLATIKLILIDIFGSLAREIEIHTSRKWRAKIKLAATRENEISIKYLNKQINILNVWLHKMF